MSGTYSNAPCTEEGYKKISIILTILEEFLINSLFHETKIPTMDMKVQEYFNFNQKNWKNRKFPSSMRNGRFHPPKYRGKVQKMGVLYTHSPKMPSPSPNTKTKI
jgi:hypothetical protein